ncbi:MAG TPA: VOC family protein [Burkholderiales bacterium]
MSVAERQVPPPGELALDHVAHYVADLDAAARVMEALGLVVTPRSAHRIRGRLSGTANRCVMLERGYIEIVAPQPKHGLRLACFGTPDAAAEHRRLRDHGFEPPPMIDLSRKIFGNKTVRFNVSITQKMPEGRVQYVEHLTPQLLWQKRYVNALRLEGLFVVAKNPAKAAARWARFAGLIPERTENGIRLETARGWVLVARRFPWKTPAAQAHAGSAVSALAGYQLGCSHPQALAARCRKAGIEVNKFGSRYVGILPAALGGALVFG